MEKDPDESDVEDPDGRTDTGAGGIGVEGGTGRSPTLILEPDAPLPLPLPFDTREEFPLGIRGVSGRVAAAVGEFLLALRGEGEPPRLLLLLMERCKNNWSTFAI